MFCDTCDNCVEDSGVGLRSRRHSSENIESRSESIISCNGCGWAFSSLDELENHIQCGVGQYVLDERPSSSNSDPSQRISPEPHICHICHEDFATADNLSMHGFISSCGREHPEDDAVFHCDHCDSYFSFEDDFLTHLQACDTPSASRNDLYEAPLPDTPSDSKPSGGRAFECPVCMETKQHLSSVPCGHLFCTACIKSALRADRRCPVCRSSARETDLRRIYLNASG
ncbi:hypothetical protein SCHPADRAFT_624224 [Schizopora paradoxa]|uniref:RING-type domain-containing protein n=1 Tax=Schizopora paradoxa TaxID=27342 RepID=A0A0H2RES4_9AGAM|nr:hypothetical protein SCHPADRAFT_624224 [Schizopora paradoxa]